MKKFTVLLVFLFLCLPAMMAQKAPAGGEWTIVKTYDIPGKASGLAFDGQYLYFGIYGAGGDAFYRFDTASGVATLLFNHPTIDDSYGMSYGNGHLWVGHQPSGSSNPSFAMEIDFDGNVISSVTLPDHYMSGIAYDDGNLWACTYYPDPGMTYQLDAAGNILSQFAPPVANQIWDVCLQDEFLWFADYNANLLYKTDLAGALLEEHPCENIKPSGVVFDGSYLWYVDGQLSSPSVLYKVDLGGIGTPEINVPVTEFNFGTVAVGDSAVWNMPIQNTGTADLTINALDYPMSVPIYSLETFPQVIEPGNATEIEIIFKPTQVYTLNAPLIIQSNDPVTPEVEIELTGEGVLAGPVIHMLSSNVDFGQVRKGALTRRTVTAQNDGDETLIITAFEGNSEYFTADPQLQLPLMIAPLNAMELALWFHPTDNETYNGTFTIQSNDPQNPSVQITVSGTGFTQAYPIADVLWSYTIDVSYDNSPKAISPIADINGDGISDVIVASEDNYIRCFNGNAHATGDVLWEHEIYSGNVWSKHGLMAVADIDGDGYQDVVAGTTGGDRSVTMLSGKTGEQIWKFYTATHWGDGGWVYQVDGSRDFTGDGINDILGCAGNDANGTGPLRTFLLDGEFGTLVWHYFLGGPGFSVIAIDDVNGDGIPEAFAGASNASETVGKIVCIDGSNGYEIWSLNTSGSSVWALLQLEDVNNDDIADVAAGTFGSGDYAAYDATNGDILFSGGIGGGFTIIDDLIRLDDVNDDGVADFTISSGSSSCVAVNGLDGTNIWYASLPDQCASVDRIGDITGDAINDVVVGTLYQDNQVVFINGVTGEELKRVNYNQPVDALAVIPDITGDISPEVVAGGREGLVACLSGGLDAWTSIPATKPHLKTFSMQCSPNPFATSTTITLSSVKPMSGSLYVITAGGRRIANLGDIAVSETSSGLQWNGTTDSGEAAVPGLYIIVLDDGNRTFVQKVIKE
ncbi:MAG: choice-of-anchor D domain-containing protein [Clostridia bacterium]|nr:choice-of-anchor D domain-containing protein [Clostridia bacterium]